MNCKLSISLFGTIYLTHLILGSIANQPFGIVEGNVRRGSPVALIVGNNLHLAMLPNADTAVGRSQIDSDGRCLTHVFSTKPVETNTTLEIIHNCTKPPRFECTVLKIVTTRPESILQSGGKAMINLSKISSHSKNLQSG